LVVKVNGPTNLDIPVNNPWLGQKFSTSIVAGGSHTVTIDPVILDPEYMVVDVKFLDTDGKLYPATAVSYYAVEVGPRLFTITNDYSTTLTFYVTLKG
jgi:hypothetical protein